ncbi:hypothetical protein [Flavivirga spongiicola]|uniref:Transposase n=1 Tax=Flavivirga spongiicola TaxID=421621 RepID=A0ABU7XXV8_9FLAO|nr:hypothetical protein [Flavivirga sp. MEBiC05379]MDO5980631.1 hypothetical protein [Flavivirga sp. MEBiC05379]
MKSTTKISRYLNSMTQENLFTDRIIPSLNNSHEDAWKRLKRYAY